MKKNRLNSRTIKASYQIWLLLAIPVLYLFIFSYIPMFGIIMAFQDFNPRDGFFSSPFIGFYNFIRFFKNVDFKKLMINTLRINLYGMIAGIPMPIILAISLNACISKSYKGIIQTITYAPHFISTIVFVGIMFQILDLRKGVINGILKNFGIEAINFMAKPELFDHVYIWSGVWQSMGFSAIIYLAVLANIDQSIYEAATIDGASIFQKIWYIEIPMIIPTFVILFILGIGGIINIGFEKIYLMQNDLNRSISDVISTYVYRRGLGRDGALPEYSYAAAVGIFQSLIGLIMLLIVNKIAKMLNQKALW